MKNSRNFEYLCIQNKGLIGPDVVKFQKFRENEFWLLTTTFILSHLHWI